MKLDSLERHMRIRGLSQRTIKSYLYYNKEFLVFASKSPLKINKNDIEGYLDKLICQSKSSATINLAYSALRMYYNEVLGRRLMVKIPRCKKAKRLPKVLSKEQVLLMIESLSNEKHKQMIKLLFGSGLRVSELRNLRFGDIDSSRGLVTIRQSKGNKDRVSIISDSLVKELRERGKNSNFDDYVFTGYASRNSLSVRTIQKVVEMAGKNIGVIGIGPHSLRHSFAIRLLEQGTDIRIIQTLLGHADIKTTLVYTKVSNRHLMKIANPLD